MFFDIMFFIIWFIENFKRFENPKDGDCKFPVKTARKKKHIFFCSVFSCGGKGKWKKLIVFAPTHPRKTGIYFLFDAFYDVFSIHL